MGPTSCVRAHRAGDPAGDGRIGALEPMPPAAGPTPLPYPADGPGQVALNLSGPTWPSRSKRTKTNAKPEAGPDAGGPAPAQRLPEPFPRASPDPLPRG